MIPIVFGKKLFGKVTIGISEFEGYYVKTTFYHFGYLPLIPDESYVIVEEDDWGLYGTFRGLPTKLQTKSILMAWIEFPLKILGIVAMMPTLIFLIGYFSDAKPQLNEWSPAIFLGWIVLSIVLGIYWASRWVLTIRSPEELDLRD